MIEYIAYAFTVNGDTSNPIVVEDYDDMTKMLAHRLHEDAGSLNIYTVHKIPLDATENAKSIRKAVQNPTSVLHNVYGDERYRYSVWPNSENVEELTRALARDLTTSSGEKIHYEDAER